MSINGKYRVELERLDHGYEARIPTIHGCFSMGLTESETLMRLRKALGLHMEAAGELPTAVETIRLEVFRT